MSLLPEPKSITENEVVLSRPDWERLAATLEDPEMVRELLEDLDDLAAAAASQAADAALAARIEAERGEPVEVTIPLEVLEAKFNGDHPVKAWREYRSWSRAALAEKAGVDSDLLADIEERRERGNIEAFDRVARALKVPIESLVEHAEEGELG